jgi:LMBR1 domain-containing protein 1
LNNERLLSIVVCTCSVALLQANRAGVVGCGSYNDTCGEINTVVVWYILFVAIAVMLLVVIPFTIFYYEADDEGHASHKKNPNSAVRRCSDTTNCRRSLASAFLYTTITLIICSALIAIPFAFLNTAEIPLKTTTVSTIDSGLFFPASSQSANKGCGSPSGCNFEATTLNLEVSFIIWLAAALMLAGWVVFIFYAGVGIIALPLDGINAFRDRPKVLKASEAANIRKALLQKTQNLLASATDLGKQLVDGSAVGMSWSDKRKFKQEEAASVRKLRVLADALDDDVVQYQTCEPRAYREHYNPIVPYLKLLGSVGGIVISLLWLVQIVLVVLIQPQVHPFLNEIFIFFDGVADFIGTALFALFTFYLLLCVIRGNLKFGTRFFIIKLHPMKPGKTLINSFLFNLMFVLLAVLPVVSLSVDSFAAYTRLTDAGVIFGTQIEFLQFFKYVFETNAQIYAFLGVAFLSLVYFIMYPSDKEYHKQVLKSIQARITLQRKEVNQAVEWGGGAAVEMTGKKR